MINSSIADHHRYKAYALYFVCVLLVLSASGCGDQTSDQAKTAPSGTGAASFSIRWHSSAINRHATGSQVHYAIEDCSALGIESITCDVYNESNTPIAHGGPWPCDAHGGRIESIPAGSGRTFTVLGWNGAGADGDVIYQGQTAGITIAPGEIADTGDIDAYPFIPQLSNPADGQTVAINSFSLTWDSLPNAYGYRILVSENSSFAAPLVDERKTETTYAPLNLLPSTTYYWMIRSIDLYGNESADSQIRHFITSELEGCQAPVLVPIGDKQIDEGMPLSFIIDANDPDTDSDVLTYRADNRPTGASFNLETRTFSWIPGHGTAGNYPVTFTVCDDCPEEPLCDSEQITISVGNVCLPPVLKEIGNQPVNEGQTLRFQLIASDPDTDSDVLTYKAYSLPKDADFDEKTGTFSWTPGYDTTDNDPVTFEGVTFEVCDDCPGAPLCDSEQITITVSNVCRPPVLAEIEDPQQVTEGQTLSFRLSAASDPDGGALTYSADSLPQEADFDDETRTFSWTPGYAGNYPVTFTVCDDCPEEPLCDSQEITITVVPAQPVAKILFLNSWLDYEDIDGGYSRLANELRDQGFGVEQNGFDEEQDDNINPVTSDHLSNYDIVVYGGDCLREINAAEATAIQDYVTGGGGLVLLGEHYHIYYASARRKDLNRVAEGWGIKFESNMLCDSSDFCTACAPDCTDIEETITCETVDRYRYAYPYIRPTITHPATDNVAQFLYTWGCSLSITDPAMTLADSSTNSWLDTYCTYISDLNEMACFLDSEKQDAYPAMAVATPGYGRVIAIGDGSMWFNSRFYETYGTVQLARSVFSYVSGQ